MEFSNTAYPGLANRVLAVGLAAAGAALAASLFYTPLPLALAIAIPASVFFLTRPYELLLVMVFLIPFNFVVPVGGVPVAAELLKVALWVPFLLGVGRSGDHIRTSRYNKYFAVIGVLIVASFFRTHDLPFTVKEAVRLGSNIGLCYLVLNLVNTREQIMQIFSVLMVSTLLVVCYGLYQFAIQDYGALFWIVNPRVDTALAHGRDAFWEWRNRMISVLTSEMEMGHYFNLCIPIGVLLWLTEGKRRLRSQWLWIAIMTLLGLVLTFTFGAWLTLAVTVVLFLLFLDKQVRWKMLEIGCGLVALIASLLAFGPFREFMQDKIAGTGMNSLAWDAYTRLDVWWFAVQTWFSHPFIGVGIGNFEYLYTDHPHVVSEWTPAGSSPHQTYLYILVMYGAIGLVSILAVFLGSIRANLRLKGNEEYGLIGLALAFALTTTLICGFSDDSGFFGPHASYLVWLLVGISEVTRRLAARQPSSSLTRPIS
jgi:O-antigen ligase